MADPSVVPGQSGGARGAGEPEAGGGRGVLRRAVFLGGGLAVSYGLVLTVLSDTFFWFAIPGMLGLAIVVLLGTQMLLFRPFGGTVPFATDGTDRRGPVKYHYRVLVLRYLLVAVPAIALVVLPLVLGVRYLGPFIAVGLLALLLGTKFWLPQLGWTWKCSRVLKVYDFEFRAPVRKSNLHAKGRRSLTLGAGGSARMAAREPLHSGRWPEKIADGVWFAGDDVFGGVLLVPGTGELMVVQPADWIVHEKARRQAGAERREKAERAGLTRKSV